MSEEKKKRAPKGSGSWQRNKMIGNTLYEFFYRNPKGKQFYGHTKKDVDEQIKKYEANKDSQVVKNTTTFYEYSKKWLRSKRIELTQRTYDDYESILDVRLQNSKLGRTQINSVDLETCKSFTDEMVDMTYTRILKNKEVKTYNYTLESIKKTWKVLNQVLTQGFNQKYINYFNLKEIKMPNVNRVANRKKTDNYVRESDMKLIYDEANKCYENDTSIYGNNAQMIIFLMFSGCRVSEAIELKWGNVRKDFGEVTISEAATSYLLRDKEGKVVLDEKGHKKKVKSSKTTKTETSRKLLTCKEEIEVLEFFYNNYSHNDDDYVFQTSNGTKMNKDNIRRTFQRMIKKLDCERKDYDLTALRHGVATFLSSKGFSPKAVQDQLGHASAHTTQKYYEHSTNKERNDIVEEKNNINANKPKESQ